MATQLAPNVAKITLIGDLSGELVINDLHFEKQTPPIDGVALAALTNAVGEWWRDTMVPLLDDRYFYLQVKGVDLTTAEGFQTTVGYSVQGGVSGGGAPNNVAFCISFKSGLAGRAGNGRNFLPGIPLQYLSGNLMNEEPLANLLAVYYPLLAGGEGVLPADWKWVNLSRRVAGAPRPVGIGIGVSAVVATDNIVDSQRRRLPGRGR